MGKGAIDVLYHKGYISKAGKFFARELKSLNEAVRKSFAASALGAKSVAESKRRLSDRLSFICR